MKFSPGPGFGGSCFPKDVNSFMRFQQKNKKNLNITQSILKINDKRINLITSFIKKNNLLNSKSNFLILGLSFKENSSDLRNSKSIELANMIYKNINKKIYGFDKFVNENHNKFIKLINIEKLYLKFYDVIIIMHNSDYLKKLDWKHLSLNSRIILDLRNILNKNKQIDIKKTFDITML